MNRIEKTIDEWVQEYTVPFNTCPDRGRVYAYSKDKHFLSLRNNDPEEIEKSFNELMNCIFIEYKGERRIILNNPKHKFEFTFLDGWYYYNFNELIDRLFKTEYKKEKAKHYSFGTEMYISVSVTAVQETLDYFNVDIDFVKHAEEYHWRLEDEDNYKFEGDGWDTNAREEYHDSSIFEDLTDALKKYFKYERAPYKKYNPDFDQYKECEHIENFNDMIDALTFDQIKQVITGDYWDNNGLTMANERDLDLDKIESLRALDKDMLKKTLSLILGKHGDRSFVYGAGVLFNL